MPIEPRYRLRCTTAAVSDRIRYAFAFSAGGFENAVRMARRLAKLEHLEFGEVFVVRDNGDGWYLEPDMSMFARQEIQPGLQAWPTCDHNPELRHA